MSQLFSCLMSYKEAIGLFSQVAVVIAVGFSGWAVLISARATRLQKDAIYTNLFASFHKELHDAIDKEVELVEKEKTIQWCMMVLNRFEYLAFLINHKFIPLKMAEYFKEMIITWYEKALIEQKGAFEEYNVNAPETFSELKSLYDRFKQN